MVTVQKPNVKLDGICIDPRDLNKAILREHYPLRTIEEVVSQMPNDKSLANSMQPSSKLCTFNTSYGRYRFVRLSLAIKSAPEVFQKIISQMVSDREGAEAITDDIRVWGSDHKEHDRRLKKVLDRPREYNLKLGAGKCEIRKSEVTYVGHRLTSEGLKHDPEKIRAINKNGKTHLYKGLADMGFIQYSANSCQIRPLFVLH